MGAALERALVDAWNRRGALAMVLWPVSALFGAIVQARKALYRIGVLRVRRAAVPVIVVGNLVAGGGGKTPLVIALVQHLQSRGLQPGVISRGHGRNRRDCREVDLNSLAHEVGDEPILIRHKTGAPVFVGQRRIDAAQALLARHPRVDLLVSDDGLQHYRMHRDIEICVFDGHGLGNGFLLPAGPLREPWPRPADFVLYAAKPVGGAGFSVRRKLASHALRADGTRVALTGLTGAGVCSNKELWAVAAIARPAAFFAMLIERGLPLAGTVALPDHADFGGPIWAATDDRTWLCTEKDAVKLWRRRPEALAVPLELEIEPAFWESFDSLLQARGGARLSFIHGHPTS